MKLVLYTEDYNVLDIIENIQNPQVESNNVEWDTGALHGINVPFLLLEDDVEINEITTGIIALDKRNQFVKVNLEQEYKQLKKQQADLSFELMIKGLI